MAGDVDLGGIMGSTMKGGKAGMSAGPEGAAIGAGVGLVTGILQNISANKAKKKADAMYPDLVDPNQSAFLSELNQKRKSIDTGADFAGGMANIDETTAGTNNAITQNTGGDAAGTVQALLQAQKNANAGKNNIIAQGQQQQGAYNQLYGNMLDQISARKLQLQMQRSQQALGEWAKLKQGANQNTQAGVNGAAQILAGLKGAGEGGADMINSQSSVLPTMTGGDSTNAPNLGGGGQFPELMGPSAGI